MKEITFTHRELDLEPFEFTATAVFDTAWDDAAICNAIRNGIMAQQGLELDELDMDKDGVVTRIPNEEITVLWTGCRGHRSLTTLPL